MRFTVYLMLIYLSLTTLFAQKKSPPNILLIMTDDQGYGDFGFNGNPYVKTPHLDQLSRRSTRLVNYHHSPVCAPTRSSLLTGRYHPRTGVHDTYNNGAIMATEEVTLAEILKANGYATGITGKWHLGEFTSYRPSDQGFSYSLIHHGGGGIGQPGDTMVNFLRTDSCYFDPVLFENNKAITTSGYCTDIFTDAAIRFIGDNKDKPFFLYVAYNAPHTPLQVPRKYEDLYKNISFDLPGDRQPDQPWTAMTEKDKEDARKVYAMATNIDDNVGRILQTLKDQQLERNTIVIFTTDNGNQQLRYNTGFRSLKGSVYEGGTHVPFLISQKGVIPEDKEIKDLYAHIDVLPTLLHASGISIPSGVKVDGLNAWPVLLGKEKAKQSREFYNAWNRGWTEPYRNAAYYQGNYKLVAVDAVEKDLKSFQLFDLSKDPFEKNNLIQQEPALALRLKNKLDSVYSDVAASSQLSPRRILLGTAEERSVVLTRQDWSGAATSKWTEEAALGNWTVTVTEEGQYQFTVIHPKPVKANTRASVRLGQIQRSVVQKTESSSIVLDPVFLKKGNYDIESWLEQGGNVTGPYYLQVTRK